MNIISTILFAIVYCGADQSVGFHNEESAVGSKYPTVFVGRGRCLTANDETPMHSVYTSVPDANACKSKCSNEANCIGITFFGKNNHCWLYGGAFNGRVNLFSGPTGQPITKISGYEYTLECWSNACVDLSAFASSCNYMKDYCPRWRGGTKPGSESWMQTNCCGTCDQLFKSIYGLAATNAEAEIHVASGPAPIPLVAAKDSESEVAKMRNDNDRLKQANESLRKALEAMTN